MTEKELLKPQTRGKKRQAATPTAAHVLARHAIDAIVDKKGFDITIIDVREVSGVADYFVLCTGEVDLQIKAIVEGIKERIKEACQERPWHVEGAEHLQWVLMDYVDVVIHVFNPEKRAFYELERLWGDAPMENLPRDAGSDAVELLPSDIAPSS